MRQVEFRENVRDFFFQGQSKLSRVVTKILSYRVNTTNSQGIKQLLV